MHTQLFHLKKKLCSILLLSLVFWTVSVTSLSAATTVTFGTIEKSPNILVWGNTQVSLYRSYDQDFLPVSVLSKLGFYVTYKASDKSVSIAASRYAPSTSKIDETILDTEGILGYQHSVYLFPITLNGNRTMGICVNGKTLIPIEALEFIYTLSYDANTYNVKTKSDHSLTATQTELINHTAFTLDVTLSDYYFSETEGILTTSSAYTVDPHQTLPRNLTSLENTTYLSTSIISAQRNTLTPAASDETSQDFSLLEYFIYNNPNQNGQYNAKLNTGYLDAKNSLPVYTPDLGDIISTEGILKAQNTINKSGLSSQTKYLVWTNIATQRTYIFEGSQGDWQLIKHFICSTGRDSTPTPKGTYKLTKKVPYFGIEKGYRCKNAFGFIGTTYLFHSLVYDITGTYLLENKGVLGQKASEGCLRFAPENAQWFYNTMISGTTVLID
jgi:lipoprotein-anchoring transpeptidase ErfK/SrfK